jgi:RHS repeat-associated protein
MSGDKLDIGVQSFFNGTGSAPAPISSLNDVLNSLVSGIVQMTAGGKGSTAQLLDNAGPVYAGVNGFLPSNESTPANKPKAYLNWILLDEQLKYVSSYPQSGAVQVGAAGVLNPLAVTGIPITKNGYLYIWVSNETPNWDVFFDNLSVVHYTGPELEETHYYPFGLTMAGISSRALKPKYVQNNFKYNSRELQNQEFSDGAGLEEYDFIGRHYDPQIGRWHNIDTKAGSLPQHSPYEYCINNPVLFVDPDGQFPYPIHIRSFAPFVTFGEILGIPGFGFAGDNRGWSTKLGAGEVKGGVTSRMQQTFIIDPSQKSITGLQTWSDMSFHGFLGHAVANDKYDVQAGFKKDGDDKVGVVVSHIAASDPLFRPLPVPDIDVHSVIRLTENVKEGNLNVQMSMEGDRFPAAEAFIGDSKGQQVFIGVSPYEGGPYTSLWGDGSEDMFYINFDIKINDKGEFLSVVSDGNTYTVDEWNKQVSATPLKYQDPEKSYRSDKGQNIFDYLSSYGIQYISESNTTNNSQDNSGGDKKWQLYGVF